MSDEEFYEDFSGWSISDEDLERRLEVARRTSDVELRRIIKQSQYFRFLVRNLLALHDREEDTREIIELMRRAAK
ncbi:MAG: hypothetical protein KF762_09505 [Acidobacteria bacterium]|nr:hypothetical protein [Acidobacteriota bacterium]